jgi:hypothetical protein
LYNGMTGEQIETSIFIGPTYYMRLKHMVKDKINFRARGPNTALTHQPVSGRANDGGLRIGEMERDSVISHGISNFLQESMMERGDKYQIAVCNQTGMIAIYNPSKNLFMSPAVDGPLQFTTAADGNSLYLNDITRFGRSFSIVSIPYTLKLLMQELQTINLQMRIITEDNIEQLENMSYSKNISKLLMNPNADENTVAEIIKTEMKKRESDNENRVKDKLESISPMESYNESPIDSSDYNTRNPQYPYGSPVYELSSSEIREMEKNATSPAYYPGSPAYYPGSPTYVPGSPAYVPGSPTYSPEKMTEADKMEETMKEWRKYWDPENQRMTHRYDEETKTWVKNKTYEEIWNIKGGQNSEFKIEEKVYLRGGRDNTLWSVKNVGDKFITIETDDPRYAGDDDNILVVSRHELLRPSEVSIAKNDGLSFDKPMFSQMGGRERNPQNDSNDGKIVFAPQIVVTTGNDNNMTIPAPSATSEMPNEHTPSPFNGESSVIRNISMAKMEPAKTDSIAEAPSKEPEPSSSGGGLLDFAKGFFIKKMT